MTKREQADEEFENRVRAQEQNANELQRNSIEYRRSIVARLRHLKILDMPRSLDLDRLYVQLRVREEQSPRFMTEDEISYLTVGEPEHLLAISREKLRLSAELAVSPEEAITRFRRIIVIGDPGAGKTTMLRHLAFKVAREEISPELILPVYVELREFVESDLEELLAHAANEMHKRYGFPDAKPYIEQELVRGGAIILLDGLDEVLGGESEEVADTAYRKVATEIDRLTTRYPNAQMVVTCRKAGWRGGLPAFQTLEVLDFDWPEIQAFIENWFGSELTKGSNLRSALSRNLRMQTLAANPLLLSLICIVYERDLELPERRAELYNRCVEVLLKDWDAHRDIRRFSHFTSDRKRDLLGEVAWHFHHFGQRYFPANELLRVIADFLPTIDLEREQAEAILNEIAAQYGLLKIQAHGWYGFLHLTIQEYFAAAAANEHGQFAISDIVKKRHNPWWEEVILLLAGRMADASSLLLGLLGRNLEAAEPGPDIALAANDDFFHGDLLLAIRCLGGTPRLRVPWLRERLVREAHQLLLKTPYMQVCENVARVLVEVGGRTIVTGLVKIIGDNSVGIERRGALLQAFDDKGDASVAPYLFDILKQQSSFSGISDDLIAGLGSLKYRPALPYLISMVEKAKKSKRPQRGRVSYKFSQLIRTIGILGDESTKSIVWSWLQELVNEKEDSRLPIYSLIYAIGALGNADDADRLLTLDLGSDDYTAVVGSVVKMTGSAYVSRIMNIVASSNTDDWAAFEIIETLDRWRVAVPAEILFTLTENTALTWQRRWGIIGLFLYCPREKCEERLCALLNEHALNDFLRLKVATVLASWGNPIGAPFLLKAFDEEGLPPVITYERASSKRFQYTWDDVSTALLQIDQATGVVPVLLDRLEQALAQAVRQNVDITRNRSADNLPANLMAVLSRFKITDIAATAIKSADNFFWISAFATKQDLPLLFEELESSKETPDRKIEIVSKIRELADAPEDAERLLLVIRKGYRHYKGDDGRYLTDTLEEITKRAGVRIFNDGRTSPIDEI